MSNEQTPLLEQLVKHADISYGLVSRFVITFTDWGELMLIWDKALTATFESIFAGKPTNGLAVVVVVDVVPIKLFNILGLWKRCVETSS